MTTEDNFPQKFPEKDANCFSRATLFWLRAVLKKGKTKISLNDIPGLLEERRNGQNYNVLNFGGEKITIWSRQGLNIFGPAELIIKNSRFSSHFIISLNLYNYLNAGSQP